MNLINKYAYDFHKYSLSEIELDLNFGNYLKDMFEFYDKSKDDNVQIVTDYIAGMTDVFALESIKQITIPKPIHFT